MLTRSRRVYTIVCIPAVALILAAWGCGGSSPAAPSSPVTPANLPEMALGSASAPITMLDYSSLACPHCADFHAETLPLIKSAYVDPGQVRIVFREFPIDDGAALSAAMVARCSADKYFTVVDLLYASQATWAGASNVAAALKTAVAPAGVSGADVDACLARADIKAAIQAMRTQGTNDYGITGVPTFIIYKSPASPQKVVGAMPYGTFDLIFKGLM